MERLLLQGAASYILFDNQYAAGSGATGRETSLPRPLPTLAPRRPRHNTRLPSHAPERACLKQQHPMPEALPQI